MVQLLAILLGLLQSGVCVVHAAAAEPDPEQAILDRHAGFTSYTADLLDSQMRFFQRANALQGGRSFEAPESAEIRARDSELKQLAAEYWKCIKTSAENGNMTCTAMLAKSLLPGTMEYGIRNLSDSDKMDYSQPRVNIEEFVKLAERAIGVKKESYFLRQAGILCLLGTTDAQGSFLISDSAYYLNVTNPIADYPQWELEQLRMTIQSIPEKGRRFLQLAHYQGDYSASELLAAMYAQGAGVEKNPQEAAKIMQEAVNMLNSQ